MPFTHPYPLCYSTCYTTLPVRPPVHYFALPVIPPYLTSRNARHTDLLVMPPYLTYHPSCSIIAPYTTLSVILPYPLPNSACGTALTVVQPYLSSHSARHTYLSIIPPPAYYSVQPVIPHCPTYHPSCCATLSVMPSCQ